MPLRNYTVNAHSLRASKFYNRMFCNYTFIISSSVVEILAAPKGRIRATLGKREILCEICALRAMYCSAVYKRFHLLV